MNRWMWVLVCGLLVGCDFAVPVTKTATTPVDQGVIGAWQRPANDGKTESLLVLPLGDTEYLVSYPAGSPDALFARACLCRVGDLALVQLEWIGTARGTVPDDAKVFQFAAYTVADGKLTVRLVNRDTVTGDIKTTDDLVKAIAAQAANPALFRDALVFDKAAK